MKRGSRFLSAVLLLSMSVLAGCGGSGKPAATASQGTVHNGDQVVTIAIGSAAPDTETSHYQQFLVAFKEQVEKETAGKVKITMHPNGVLGGEREMVEAVQLGTLDAVITGAGPLGNFAPMFNALDFPFLFRDREHAYKVLDGEVGAEIAKQLEDQGMKLIVWPENGFRNMTNNKHPVKKPEDLKGLKLRTQENKVHLDVFRDYGASPTPMAFTELFTAMQQGVIDGEENPLSVIIPNKFYEVQKHMTISEHFYQAAPFIINKAKFDSLTPEQQKIIQAAAEAARDHEREFIFKMNNQFLQTARDNGMQIVPREEFDREAFVQASEHVYKKYEQEYGDLIKKIRNTQ
ncbi:TRAP transporter substrate-binding protein [Brevibacillus sp. B_LB10_24]|uniref:TRAP transporter substrate-binding protein n=1 Tax=Brevibacillus sp. B_LB10_24 TaxID=3380645 RepID=UPI0038B8E73E